MVMFIEKPTGTSGGLQGTHQDEVRDNDDDSVESSSANTLLIDTYIEAAKPISISMENVGVYSISNNNSSSSIIIDQSSSTNHQAIESERIDISKFILILLVAIGHFIEPYYKVGNTTATIIIHLIYSFHIPAFICISGYTSSDYMDNKKRRRKLIGSLLVPYLILQPLFCIWYSYAVKRNTMDDDIEDEIEDEHAMLTPNWSLYNQQPWTYTYPFAHLWYLVSLFTMRIWRPFALEFRYTIVVHVLFGCAIGYSTYIGRYLSLHRTVVLMPYFLLGCVMKEKQCFFSYAKSIQMRFGLVFASVLLLGTAIFATQHGLPVEIWFQADPYSTVYKEYRIFGCIFQLACYAWTSVAMVVFFALIPPPSVCGVQYYDTVDTETDLETTTKTDEEVDDSCCASLRCTATRQRRRRPGQAVEKEQDIFMARVHLRIAKWGQRSLYAYILHMAGLMMIAQFGYYDGLWNIYDSADAQLTSNEWRTNLQVIGTVIMATVLTISLLLRPFFPTCLRCVLEPDVEQMLFQP